MGLYSRFPNKINDKQRYSQWVHNCRRVKEPGLWSLGCTEHFTEECFDRIGETVRLKPNAVPTIFKLPTYLQVCIIGLKGHI
jgi:uncharacterized protein YbdZ (MbtH family)